MNDRKPAAITTAALLAGFAVFQPAPSEPHSHYGETAPTELILNTGFGAGQFTNTAAAAISVSSSPAWNLPSSSATFDHDIDFASRMRCAGIMVYVLPPSA